MSVDFCADVARNPVNRAILSRWKLLDLPNAWLVAGCLFQTVWNIESGRQPGADLKDYDVFYFDSGDPGEEPPGLRCTHRPETSHA